MLYHYIASDKSGKVVESEIDADDVKQVLQLLAGKDLRPISVKPLREKKNVFTFFFRKITLTDKVFLCKYLSLMLRVGTDLLSAINILIADFEKPAMRNFLLEVRENLNKGQPFYKAFESNGKYFSTTFTNLVKAGEKSGNLQQTFDDLSISLIREAELRSKVRSALIYPFILLGASLAIIVFLVTFAIPRIGKVFIESGINPPFFSKIVFGVGLFLGKHIVFLLVAFFVTIGIALYFYYRTKVGKRIVDIILSRTPFIRKLSKDIAVQRLSATMSSLMKAGLPIIETIRISADTIGFNEYKYALLRITDEGLAKGLTIGEAFKRESVFPIVLTNLIVISEKAGHLEEVLATIADFYASSVDSGIKALVSLLEPGLLLVMGSVVATISLSIIIPIYQLTSQF